MVPSPSLSIMANSIRIIIPECMPSAPIMPPPRIMPKPMSRRPQSRSRLEPSPWCQPIISLSSSKSSPAPRRGIWAPCGVRSCCCWGCACCCIIGPCCAVAAVPPHARTKADVASIRMRFCILTSLRSPRPIQLLTSDIDPLAFVTGMTSNAPSKVLGDEFQDFLALAINLYCFLAHPWFLHQCFRLNCISYRFVEQDLRRFVSWHEALSDQRAIERDRRGEGRHVVSRVIELVHRWLFTRPPQGGAAGSLTAAGDEDAGTTCAQTTNILR